MKSDERVLGDGSFVEKALRKADENLERKYALWAETYDFNWLFRQVAQELGLDPDDVSVESAVRAYVSAVKAKQFPDEQHTFK